MLLSALYYGMICCLCGICIGLVPEVSQEGLLRPYVSYSDVTLLHYHLPQQLASATWEFAAFMDDPGCPTRTVHVLLQHGSYPLVSPHNDTFAPYMYDERSSLHKVSTETGYRPHDATLLALDSPLPGSWYAAAYIPHWDQQMQQEGLIHKCRYSLGSIAMWRQQDGVHTLHPGHVTQVLTSRNLEYYRFYVPSHTWLLKVTLSNCQKMEDRGRQPDEASAAAAVTFESEDNTTSTPVPTNFSGDTGRWCVRWAGLRARALPQYDLQSPGATNVSSGSGHVFREERPYTDSYYYLLLYTEGQTRITVAIATRECGGVFKNPHSRVERSTGTVVDPASGRSSFVSDAEEGKPGTSFVMRGHEGSPEAPSSTHKPILNSPSHAINIKQHEVMKAKSSFNSKGSKKNTVKGRAQIPLVVKDATTAAPSQNHGENLSDVTSSPVLDIQSSDLLKSANHLNKTFTIKKDRRENVIKGYLDAKNYGIGIYAGAALNGTLASFTGGIITTANESTSSSFVVPFRGKDNANYNSMSGNINSFVSNSIDSDTTKKGYSAGESVKLGSLLRVEATVTVFTNSENNKNASDSFSDLKSNTSDYSSSIVMSQPDDIWTSDAFSELGPYKPEDEEDAAEEEFVCYPVLPLARIKHAMDFTDTFLIQGPEWYSTWVSVRADSPVFTYLTLLPHTDIGGTLTIALHLDPLLQNATHQLVTVEGCARKGRAPPLSPSSNTTPSRLSCSPHLSLQATSLPSLPQVGEQQDGGGEEGGWWWEEEGNDAKFRKAKNLLLVPFPEPDEWYLGLMVVCYSDGIRAPCALSEVVVSVEARTQPCLYAGALPCGPHGTCVETHKGLMAYSSCKCTGGWRGWGCQQRADTHGFSLTGVLLLTLSNGFFVPPIVAAIRCHLPSHALLYAATMLASVLYHLCDNQVVSYCITRYEVLQFTDFFFSLLCFWVTVVGLAPHVPSSGWKGQVGRPSSFFNLRSCCQRKRRNNGDGAALFCCGCSDHNINTCCNSDESLDDDGGDDSGSKLSGVWHTMGVVVIAPCVQYSRTALASFAIPMALAATVPVGSGLCRWWRGGGWPRVGRRTLLWRAVGALLALTGLTMFAVVQTKHNYKYVHSFWHSTIALSLLFLLPAPLEEDNHRSSSRRRGRARCHCDLSNIDSTVTSAGISMQQQQQLEPEQRGPHGTNSGNNPSEIGCTRYVHRSFPSITSDLSINVPNNSVSATSSANCIFSNNYSLDASQVYVFVSPHPSTERATETSLPSSYDSGDGGMEVSEVAYGDVDCTAVESESSEPPFGQPAATQGFIDRLLSRARNSSRKRLIEGLRSSFNSSWDRSGKSLGFNLRAITDEDADLLDVGVAPAVDYTDGGVDVRSQFNIDDDKLILLDDS